MAPANEQMLPARFKDPVIYNSGGLYADSAAIGDLNGDGNPDLVVTNACPCGGDDGAISVLLGNGDGTFQPPASYDSGGEEPFSVAIGDVNGDGKPDLVVVNLCQIGNSCFYPYAGGVGVLLGNGDGTFQTAISYSSSLYSRGDTRALIVIGDVNGDGKPDLVVSSECQSSDNCDYPTGPGGVSVLLGNGDGTFQAAVSYSSGGYDATSVVIADLNGDGHPDLVVSNSCLGDNNCQPYTRWAGGISILLGNGNGTLQLPVNFNSGGYFAYWLATADMNGDGKPDLVVVNGCDNNNCGPGNLAVFLGNGDATFQNPVTYDGPYGAISVAIGDVNGDGKLDLVVSSDDGLDFRDSVSVLPGGGDGTFQAPVSFYPGGYDRASLVAIGDLNHDGKPDLVVPNDCSANEKFGYCPTNGTVGVLLNNFTATTTATLTSSPNPSLVNQSVTFTATITSISSVPDGSTVAFYDHEIKLGTGTTTNGVAMLTTSFSKAGAMTYKAIYSGDVFHKPSVGKVKQVVNP